MQREDQFIPHLIVSNGLAALDFYKEVFGAEEGHRMISSGLNPNPNAVGRSET